MNFLFAFRKIISWQSAVYAERKNKTNYGWESLENVRQKVELKNLKNADLQKNDNLNLMAEVSSVDIQRCCTRVETRQKIALDRTPFEKVVEYIKDHVISRGKVKSMT